MERFKTWEEMTLLEQYQCQYWDMYKDAYGFRPRGIDTSGWTEADFEKEFAALGNVIERELAREREEQKVAIREFENLVTRYISNGAGDRETALLWIMRDSDVGGDLEYLAFRKGLPYGYFKQTV